MIFFLFITMIRGKARAKENKYRWVSVYWERLRKERRNLVIILINIDGCRYIEFLFITMIRGKATAKENKYRWVSVYWERLRKERRNFVIIRWSPRPFFPSLWRWSPRTRAHALHTDLLHSTRTSCARVWGAAHNQRGPWQEDRTNEQHGLHGRISFFMTGRDIGCGRSYVTITLQRGVSL